MKFRYLPMTEEDRREMLSAIGVDSVDDLFADIPEGVRYRGRLNLPDGLSEPELVRHMQRLSQKNTTFDQAICFLGAGAYEHHIPSVVDHIISRSEFYTAYTPYQPEISQGELQAIFEFQTMICELTGMEVANSSMYDGPTALAEAAVGRPELGRQLAEEGMRLYPHIPELILHLGALRERAGVAEEAEVFYRRAVEEAPELPQARKALGDALYRRGAYEEATEQYRRAIELRPELGDDVYLKLGNIAYKQGERGEAVGLWTRALELNPENGIARTNLELVQRVLASSPS